jgi:hypothetical protein
MSDRTHAGLVFGLAVASFAAYAVGIAYPCWVGLVVAGIVLGVCARILARKIDADYATHPRFARLSRSMAQLALAVALLTPLWMFAVGEMMWSRRQQGFSRALRDVRALAEAQESVRKAAGTYLTLDCLARGSDCPSGLNAPRLPNLLEPVRDGYRYTLRGVPSIGGGGRLEAFAYVADPTTEGSDCGASLDALVCTDSAGRLCRMPAATASPFALDSAKCPAGCIDILGPRPAPSPS